MTVAAAVADRLPAQGREDRPARRLVLDADCTLLPRHLEKAMHVEM
jgi:hypothetical protein